MFRLLINFLFRGVTKVKEDYDPALFETDEDIWNDWDGGWDIDDDNLWNSLDDDDDYPG